MVRARQARKAECGKSRSGLKKFGVVTQQSSAGIAEVVASSSSQAPVLKKSFLDLPSEITMKILQYLPMKMVAATRLVCRRFNAISGEALTSTFERLRMHAFERVNSIKQQMPRRESARRLHPRARELMILENLSSKLSLLHSVFSIHVSAGDICFFPGEILDEVQRIFRFVNSVPVIETPAFRVTEELHDLCFMACEYFEEKLKPGLPRSPYSGWDLSSCGERDPVTTSNDRGSTSGDAFGDGPSRAGLAPNVLPMGPSSAIVLPAKRKSIALDVTSASTSNISAPASDVVVKKSIRRLRLAMRKHNSELILLRKDLKVCKKRVVVQKKLLKKYHSRLEEHDKKCEDSMKKYSALAKKLNTCETELTYWRSMAPPALQRASAGSSKECGRSSTNAMQLGDDEQQDGPVPTHQRIVAVPCQKHVSSKSEVAVHEATPAEAPAVPSSTMLKKRCKKAAQGASQVQSKAPVPQPKAQPPQQQRPVIGKRKREAVSDHHHSPTGCLLVGDQVAPWDHAASSKALAPSSSMNLLRSKVAKQRMASNAGVAVGKAAGGSKRLKPL